MSKRSKACDISMKVKKIVWERDKHHCINCGNPYAMPNAHYIPRSHGGLGIEQNIVTLCQKCHNNFDNGKDKDLKESIKAKIKTHLRANYSDWDNYTLTYKKSL